MSWVKVRDLFVKQLKQGVIDPLLDDLNDVIQKQVLSDEGVERLKEISAPVQDQARTYIDRVRRKGQEASIRAVESIHPQDASSAEQEGLTANASGNLPEDSLPAPPPGAILPVEEIQPVQSRQGIKLCPQNLFEKIQKEKSHKIYPSIRDSEKRTRLALIICNTEFDYFGRRDGSEVDMAGMECLLTGLGYQVLSKTNLCSKGMADCLKDFASREEHKTSDSTFVVLMSHGVRAGLCGVKSEETKEGFSDILSHDTIYSILNNQNCPALRDKPKVIIIQACRGENKGIIYVSDAAVSSADSVSSTPWLPDDYESDAIRREHVESDLICFCSTTPDNVSWRSPKTGSIFIVQLRRQMQEYAWCCHLEEIFRMVQQEFKNNPRQMPTKERATLLKRFYLFPGH